MILLIHLREPSSLKGKVSGAIIIKPICLRLEDTMILKLYVGIKSTHLKPEKEIPFHLGI